MTLWTAADAAAATDGQTTGAWQVSGISIDTRSLQPGDFVRGAFCRARWA